MDAFQAENGDEMQMTSTELGELIKIGALPQSPQLISEKIKTAAVLDKG